MMSRRLPLDSSASGFGESEFVYIALRHNSNKKKELCP